MKIGYNTNGFAFHRWQDTLEILAELGYQSVAITVDHYCLNPFGEHFSKEIDEFRSKLKELGLSCVVETGARFLLDSRRKHEPTFISSTEEARQQRITFLCCCVNIARQLGADAVSFWSGIKPPSMTDEEAHTHLADGCRYVTEYAAKNHVKIGFEPEPGMLIETMDQYSRLKSMIASPNFGLTLDIGHLQCVEHEPIASFIERFADQVFNIHIEDMVRGEHEHLRFGDGEIEFPPAIAQLKRIGYSGGLHVELSRHSHMAPTVAAESFNFLTNLVSDSHSN